MRQQALSVSVSAPGAVSYTLSRNVSAIQILPSEDGRSSRLGLLTQLPAETELCLVGPGFNERTVRVQSCGSSYYVFFEDLEPTRKPASSARAVAG